ncbi:uncharacterized protein LOC125372432 [Haliotis rufescens]|uniref:uncharacterized protein LOC125372432 n=1 Tax=Haliotis rufescens TaxID=6454 RepID=UPI00201F593E|nr:uncharacterized protein LOC125372432 [Haliotis rufescens]
MIVLGLTSVVLAVSVHYACCCRPAPKKNPPNAWCPSIHSPKYADAGKNTATVLWQLPVTSNCYKVTLIKGSPPGSAFAEGRHCIQYRTSNACTGLSSYCGDRCFTVNGRSFVSFPLI